MKSESRATEAEARAAKAEARAIEAQREKKKAWSLDGYGGIRAHGQRQRW